MDTRFSYSRLADLKACGLRYYYKHIIGLRKPQDEVDQHHLRYGSAMHSALEILYSGNYAHHQGDNPAGLLDLAKQTFLESYPRQLDPSDKAKTQENGLLVLDWYTRHWKEEDQKWKVITVEEPSDTDSWSLRIDLVMENVEYGGTYIYDHKITKKYLNYEFWNGFEPNSQVTQYIAHVKEQYGECSGFFINAISMGYRQRAYKGEPAGFYAKFERQMFNRNREQLEQERQSTERWVEIAAKAKRRVDAGLSAISAYGFNTDSCRFCEFRPACAAGWTWPEDQSLIELQYRRACLTIIPDGRCVLDKDHQGEHSLELPLTEEFNVEVTEEFNVEVEI